MNIEPSNKEEIDEALREKLKKHSEEWAEPVDKTTNWRFAQLYAAGFDIAACEELANNRHIDLHKACALAEEHGAHVAYLRLT